MRICVLIEYSILGRTPEYVCVCIKNVKLNCIKWPFVGQKLA